MSNLTDRTSNGTATMPSKSICVRAGVLAVAVTLMWLSAVGKASADFGITTFTSDFQDVNGLPMTQAGSHADVSTFLHFNTRTDGSGNVLMEGQARDIEVDMPAGFYGNPQAMPACSMQEIIDADGYCQPAAQVGVLNYEVPGTGGFFADFPVYNLRSTDSQTAVLGVVAVSVPAKIIVSVRTAGDYGIHARLSNLNQALSLTKTRLTLWGVPADPVHDVQRFYPNGGLFGSGAPAGVPPRPFLSLPSRCEPVTTTLRADSWQNPGVWVSASVTSPPLTGCDQLKFDASIKARPQTTVAGVPSGFDVGLTVPQDDSVKGLATPTLRKAVVALPVGTRVSPASADGLGACSDADLKIGTDQEPSCPASSKVGTVSIDTPVLADPVEGDIVLGTQRPDQLLRLWFVLRGPGLLLKIPGKVDPDPVTGQLIATFADTPQLPFTTLQTSFQGGPYASLTNPKACGVYTTRATLTPWSGGPAVQAEDSFTIDRNCDQAGRFEPALDAGVVDPAGGASSPFVFNLSRPSGQQDFSSLEATLPGGLLGRVGRVPLCPGAQAAAGTCSAASRIGFVTARVGAGASPLAVPEPGKTPTAVYLAGPYKGAPYSLSVVVPAQAGPFDLGTVVVRAALHVDPDDAHVTVKSDPLPTILQGIPLDVQRLSVAIDRPGFILNPTSCAAKAIKATVTSTEGKTASPSSRFQASECSQLGFTPKLAMRVTGKRQLKTGGHPALKSVLTQGKGQAAIGKADVVLPKSIVLDPRNSTDPKLVCGYDASLTADCPASSVIGSATAVSPVLSKPLSGKVHLVQGIRFGPSGNRIRTTPSLLVKLRGEVAINVRAKTTVRNNRLVTTFPAVPDAPVSRFNLNINGGSKGILVVTRTAKSKINLCRSKQTAAISLDSHNGKTAAFATPLKTPCGVQAAKRAGRKR